MLDELIQRVEQYIAEKLARQAADGQADIGLGMKQRFVRRDLPEQGDIAAQCRFRADGVLQDNFPCNRIQLTEGLLWLRQPCQLGLPLGQQEMAVDGWKKRADVHLTVVAVAGHPHEALQSADGAVGALADAIGETIVDPGAFYRRADDRDQPLLGQAVAKSRGEDFAQFGILDGECGHPARLVDFRINVMRERTNDAGYFDQVAAFVDAVAGLVDAGIKLAGDFCFGHGS